VSEQEEFNTIKKLETGAGWEEYRALGSLYKVEETFIPAIRKYRPIISLREDASLRDYEMLQCSRGLTVEEQHTNIDDLAKSVAEKELKLDLSDMHRIKILQKCFGAMDKNYPADIKSIAEWGFRAPKLLEYYSAYGGIEVRGYDVVSINIMVGKKLGYDVRLKDFNEHIDELDLSDMADLDMIISYHMLEHISRPDLVIQKLYRNMKPGAYIHVEVPIEPVLTCPDLFPAEKRIRAGHLFPFHEWDLGHILEHAGFNVLYGMGVRPPDASPGVPRVDEWAENYFAQKPV